MYSALKVFIVSAFLIGVAYLLLEIYKHRYFQFSRKVLFETEKLKIAPMKESDNLSSSDDMIDAYEYDLSKQIREEAEELSNDSVEKATLLSQLKLPVNEVKASDESLINAFV
jgi:hypothetical protein